MYLSKVEISIANSNHYSRIRGDKTYELSNHLGNVLATITDRKLGFSTGIKSQSLFATHYQAEVTSATDYYPFGSPMSKRSVFDYKLKYGFNSAEKHNELDNLDGLDYDLGARFYSSKLGRMFSPDPRESDYPWQSTYAYFSNSPISQVDFNGEGDYYDKEGKHLGKDRNDDNKAYVTTLDVIDKTKNEKGETDWEKVILKSKLLKLSNSELNIFANTISQESSGNKLESYGIASAINNLANLKGKSILGTLQTEGIYGYKDGGNNTLYENNSEYGMGAAINAVTGGFDYSYGAIRWDGYDFAARGFLHPKSKESGIDISEQHLKFFKEYWSDDRITKNSGGQYIEFSKNIWAGRSSALSHYKNGNKNPNVGMVLYKSTAVHGGTIFWGANKNASYDVLKITTGYKYNIAYPIFNLDKIYPNEKAYWKGL